MDRRDFLSRLTAATAGCTAVQPTEAAAHASVRNVTYLINGFTCITCAVGLEVMLRGLQGVIEVHASYPQNKCVVRYDAHVTSVRTIEDFIMNCGFTVA